MTRLYEPEAYDTAHWPPSFWRATAPAMTPFPSLEGAQEAEVAIIGAGYAGLNAALELAERFGIQACVLEAGQPGWGASGRNGGFACMGGAKLDAAQMARRFDTAAAVEWEAFEHAAIDRVRDNLARYGIDADPGPSGEVCLAHNPRAFARLRAEAGSGCEIWTTSDLARRGLRGRGFHGGLYRPQGFGLHPLKYAQGLAGAVRAAGIRLHGDSAVTSLARDGTHWRLHTARGSLRARRVLIATNGYSDESLPAWLGGRLFPILSAILVTRPLTEQERAAQGWTSQIMAYDSRRILHYFRLLPCGRFLFGGRGGASASPAALADFERVLRREFEEVFPGFAQARTEHYWSGLVCLTASLTPFCGAIPAADGLFAALGWHGNGVAAASEGGRRIAQALAGHANPAPRVARAPLRRFPAPALRRPLLGPAVALAKLADQWW